MRIFILIWMLVNVGFAVAAQEKNAYVSKYDLTIPVPNGYVEMPVDDANEMHKQGVQMVKNQLGEDVRIVIETLLILKKNDDNQLIVEVQPFDTLLLGNFDMYREKMNNMFYKTIATNIAPGTIDTFHSKQKVGSLNFESLKSVIKLPDGSQRNVAVIKRLMGTEQLSFTLIYSDEQHEKILLNALKHSSFGAIKKQER